MIKKEKYKTLLFIIVEILLVLGGFIADILYWNNVYRTKEIVGHGVPFLSIIGIFLALILGVVFSIFYTIKKDKNKGGKK